MPAHGAGASGPHASSQRGPATRTGFTPPQCKRHVVWGEWMSPTQAVRRKAAEEARLTLLQNVSDRRLRKWMVSVASFREDFVRELEAFWIAGEIAIQRHDQLPPPDANHVALHRWIRRRIAVGD